MRFVFFLLLAAALNAAPRLHLLQNALSIPVVPGSNGPAQTVDALNSGDGQLNLQATSSVPWLALSIGQTDFCGLLGPCIPVQIALQTASLAKGTYTGTITVSDPNAIDAPQFIAVTVAVGGSVPDKLEFYLPPGGGASSSFSTVSAPNLSLSSSPWLASFVNGTKVSMVIAASTGMATGDYNGSITITGSSFAPDNKTVSVVLHVTTQPILGANPSALQFRIAQGANKQTAAIAITNSGQGTLSLSSSGVTASTSSGNWISVQGNLQGLTVTADPSGLSPDTYSGTITIASNAANSSVVIPVELIVAASTAPVVSSAGIIANDTQGGGALAQGDVVSMFGDQFTYGDPQNAPSLPLNTTLGGVQVLVNNQRAPLYYVSPTQINFEVPIDANLGDGTVQVVRNGQAGNLAYINIKDRVPNFLLLNGGSYAIMTTANNDLTGIPSHPLKSGDAVVIYTIGLGPTSPIVPSGTASPSDPNALAKLNVSTQVCFGAQTPFFQPPCATPFFAGLSPGFVGLYQINVIIPDGVPSGTTPVYFLVNGIPSDTVQIAVQ